MDMQAIRQVQEDIVRAVADNVADVMEGEWENREWLHLFVDFEIDQDGTRSSSIAFALARRPGQALGKVAFRLSAQAKQRLNDLAEAMRRPGEDRWSTTQLRIEQDGSFAFDFSYDPPWRLGGNLVDKRFEGYLDRWLEKPQGEKFAQAESKSRPGLGDRLRSVFGLRT